MLAVKKLMPMSLLIYRFTGTTRQCHNEIIIAVENIIVDKVSTVPSSKIRRNDTSAPMETGMAAKRNGESVSQEGDQRIMDLALQAVHKGTGKGKWRFSKGQNWNEKGGKGGKDEGKNSWQQKGKQWQDVISKQNKRKGKKANQASLLSMGNSHNSNPKRLWR